MDTFLARSTCTGGISDRTIRTALELSAIDDGTELTFGVVCANVNFHFIFATLDDIAGCSRTADSSNLVELEVFLANHAEKLFDGVVFGIHQLRFHT